MPSSHMHGGIAGCTRQVWRQELGKIWTPSSPQSRNGQGSRAAPWLLSFPWPRLCCCSPEALGLLLGVLRIPRASARITPCSVFLVRSVVFVRCSAVPSLLLCAAEEGSDGSREGRQERGPVSPTPPIQRGAELARGSPGCCHHASPGTATMPARALPPHQPGLAEQLTGRTAPRGVAWQRPRGQWQHLPPHLP